MKWKYGYFSNHLNARETITSPKMACTVLPIYHQAEDYTHTHIYIYIYIYMYIYILYISIKNASDSFYQDWHFVRLSFHQAVHLGTTGAVFSLKYVTSNFLSTSLAYKTWKWNGCLDKTRICESKENISSTLFKYGWQKPIIKCKWTNTRRPRLTANWNRHGRCDIRLHAIWHEWKWCKLSYNVPVQAIRSLSKKFVQWVGGGVGCELVAHPSSSLHSTGPSWRSVGARPL